MTMVSFASALLGFCTVYLVSELINHATNAAPLELMHFYVPAFIGCILGRELLDYFTRKYGEAFSTIYCDHLMLRFQKTLLQLRFTALANITAAKLQSLTARYTSNVRSFIEDWFWGSSRKLVQLVITLVILYLQSPLILVGNLVFFALFLAIAQSISAKLSPIAARYAEEDIAASSTIGSFTYNLPTVRRLGIGEFFSAAFERVIHRKWEQFTAVREFHARRWLLQLMLYDLGYITTLAVGVYQVATGRLALGYLVLIKYAFDTLSGILIYAIEYYVLLVQQRQDSALVRRELGALEAHGAAAQRHRLGSWHELQLTQACSTFNPESAAPGSTVRIEVPELTILRGAKIGIIGPSGAGKTTILQMLLNLVEFSGDYNCDGLSLRGKQLMAEDVTLINNSDPLFALSLRDNIVLGRPISAEKLRAVLDLVCATEFTENLESEVGDPTFNLSAGQQQRIRLARGLLGTGNLVLLDEPFNGLDEPSKMQIIKSMRTLLVNHTIILVTHNTQELALVDTVYRLEEGRLLPISS
ncbi:MAG: ABC transporter ATP-binding protein [Proteobacteria bacterium]|nr:ABC transporter ATP-binding protein [Pseudomonadota bacterium]